MFLGDSLNRIEEEAPQLRLLSCEEAQNEMEKNRNLIPDKYDKELKQNSSSLVFTSQFNNQDFVKLRNYCLDHGLLFEDDTFPANRSSIGFNLLPDEKLNQVQWLRPPVLDQNPNLFVDGVSRFDIIQGERVGHCAGHIFSCTHNDVLGSWFQKADCWVLAALGSLTQQERFLEKVIPKDQGFNCNYAGIFHFQFWYFGNWVDVVVDDRLPFVNGKYLSVHPRSQNEFWPPLLEKAYAKLRGSYQKLHFGHISEALVDLTGGVQLAFNLRSPPAHLYDTMKKAAQSGSLMACSTPKGIQGQNVLENGIVPQHVYAVTCAREIPYMYRKEHLIRLWNPWGTEEWKGAWSDKSGKWNRISEKYKKELHEDRIDEFKMINGANVVVSLTQRPENHSHKLMPIGFWMQKDVQQGRITVHDMKLILTRDVTFAFKLDPGHYIITPTISSQNQESELLLRIFLKSQDNLREQNTGFYSAGAKDMPRWNQVNCENIFLKYAHQSSYLDASQLQRILNDVILKDLMASLGNGDGFSFDSCKSLLALMDINANGKLSFQEFGKLWKAFKKYEDLFRREDKNNSGFLNGSNLRRIMQETGLNISDKLLQLLVVRYGDSALRINFPGFVCCMIRLETMEKVFHNLSINRRGIYFTEDEWITMIMYC